MVSDNRVTKTMARLGGVYRDPARVSRDASALLLSSVGTYLSPIPVLHVDDNGESHTVLVLQGTIAIHYRGQTYQQLVDIYLVPYYPNRPPICYVRLAPNMYLKENHKHVEKDGKVYMPYLHEWNPTTHNLIEMTVALSSVFSADPPVFSRPPPPAVSVPPPPQKVPIPPPPPPAYIPSTHVTSVPIVTATGGGGGWNSIQQQQEALLAQEAADANAAAEAARRAEYEEQQALEHKKALEAYEKAQLNQVKASLTAKLQTYCRECAAQTQQRVRQDVMDQKQLQTSSQTLDGQIAMLREKQSALQRQISTVHDRTEEITKWLSTNANNGTTASTNVTKKSVDEICIGATKMHQQMLELAAENASISDTLYFLDRGLMTQGSAAALQDMTDHLRQIRKLAQRQFLVRAHLLKITSRAASAGKQ